MEQSAQTQQKKRSTAFWIVVTILVLFLCLIVSCIGGFIILAANSNKAQSKTQSYQYEHVTGQENSENKFLIVRVDGIILGENTSGADPFSIISSGGATYGYSIKESLYRAANDPKIKGVVLEVNSPGGTIFGAGAISDGVEYYRSKTNKPVITHVSGMAASGAYWTAVSTDYIIADQGSLTGSIGVIFGPFKYYDKVLSEGSILGSVTTENGIQSQYITAGKSKDVGDPYRKMTPEEVQHMQKLVNNEYDGFVKYVSERRGIPESSIRNTIGALIFDNESAIDSGLIDESGNREEAYAYLMEKAGVKGNDYEFIQEVPKLGFLGTLLGSSAKVSEQKVGTPYKCVLCNSILFLYGSPDEYEIE